MSKIVKYMGEIKMSYFSKPVRLDPRGYPSDGLVLKIDGKNIWAIREKDSPKTLVYLVPNNPHIQQLDSDITLVEYLDVPEDLIKKTLDALSQHPRLRKDIVVLTFQGPKNYQWAD